MEPVSLYSKDYNVEVNHVDFNGILKLSSLFTYFQDIAGLHAENLGMGMKTLYKNHGVLWVLARIRVDIVRYPMWNEKITIETWCKRQVLFLKFRKIIFPNNFQFLIL